MTLENLSRKTVLRTARDFDQSATTTPFVIFNLKQCYVYILACLAEITIKDCVDSVIIAGVARTVTLENCLRCVVISISKALKIQTCTDTTVHMCVNSRPVLTLGNNNLVLAPYNSFYSQLDSHIQQIGIKTGVKENLWSSPMDFARSRSVSMLIANKAPAIEEKQAPSFSFMEPEEFTPFVVPFQLPGNTKANPVELPSEYAQALQQKARKINSLKSMIDSVPDSAKDDLRRAIEEKFREWLVQSGNIDQVNDLINFHLQ